MFDKIVDSIACYSLLNITMVGTIKRRSSSGRRFFIQKTGCALGDTAC